MNGEENDNVILMLHDKPNGFGNDLLNLFKSRLATSKMSKISNQFSKSVNFENCKHVETLGMVNKYGKPARGLNNKFFFNIPMDIAISYKHELIYVDARFLSNPHDEKSQAGYLFTCEGATISW